MKTTLFILTLLISLNLTAQNLRELEADLSQTGITEVKKIEKKAGSIFEIDPFNEIATYYLTESYRYTKNDSLFHNFFKRKISEYPGNPKPYLIAAKYQHSDFSLSDTARLQDLKKALALEPNNFEANNLIGASYYQLFNEKVSSDSLSKPAYFALQSQKFLKQTVGIDSVTFAYLKYPIIQLSTFLKDAETANQFEKSDPKPSVDENHIPGEGQYYFPVSRFVELEENWQSSYKTNVYRTVFMATYLLEWYSGHLKALNEPLIIDQVTDTIYRFTWLRTFHHPMAIRIQKTTNDIRLTWKMSDGKGGYDPGKLFIDESKRLTVAEWKQFQELLKKVDYWNLPTIEKSGVMITDGSRWIIEGVKNGKYNVVDRHTPGKSTYQEIGMFLINLTDLEIPKEDMY
jgi:hypothetical protein